VGSILFFYPREDNMNREQLMAVWKSHREAYVSFGELQEAIKSAWDEMSPGEQALCEKALLESRERLSALREEYKKKSRQFFGY
jgi:hypothetical protein